MFFQGCLYTVETKSKLFWKSRFQFNASWHPTPSQYKDTNSKGLFIMKVYMRISTSSGWEGWFTLMVCLSTLRMIRQNWESKLYNSNSVQTGFCIRNFWHSSLNKYIDYSENFFIPYVNCSLFVCSWIHCQRWNCLNCIPKWVISKKILQHCR